MVTTAVVAATAEDSDDVIKAPEQPLQTSGPFHDEETQNQDNFVSPNLTVSQPKPGDKDFDENNAPVQFVVNEWAQSSSINGVPFVTDSLKWKLWKRAVWIGLVLASSCMMLVQITFLIQEYKDYEVLTNTETVNPENLEFPEVSVCNLHAFSKKLMRETGITDPLNKDELLKISTPLEDFMKHTFFNEKELDVSKVWHSRIGGETLGRCWYFNTNEPVWAAGYNAGLRIMVDVQQDDYDDNANLAGIGIFTQQRGSVIGNQVAATAIKPGKVALVNMKMKRIIREREAPWARCFSNAPNYTQPRCRNECVYAFIRKNCGCRRYADEEEPDLRYCQVNNPEDQSCVAQSNENIAAVLHGCSCTLPTCSVTTYPASIVEVDRPKGWFDRFQNERNITKSYLSENYVLVTINFDELQYEVLTQSKAVTPAQLLGSIGGSMGFFLGISMISVLELIGDLGLMRLLPRFCGQRHLLGVGARKSM